MNPGNAAQSSIFSTFLSLSLGLLVGFAALANGAHDIWAATLVYVGVLGFFIFILFVYGWSENSPGISLSFILPLLLVLISFFVSFHFSVNPSESYLAIMDWTAAALLFLISIHIFQTEKSIQPLLYFMIPVLLIQSYFHFHQKLEPTYSFFSLATAGTLPDRKGVPETSPYFPTCRIGSRLSASRRCSSS